MKKRTQFFAENIGVVKWVRENEPTWWSRKSGSREWLCVRAADGVTRFAMQAALRFGTSSLRVGLLRVGVPGSINLR